MAFRFGIDDAIKVVPQSIRGQFKEIVKGMDSDTFFADDSWNGAVTKVFMVKMSKDNYDIALTRKIGGTHKLSQGRRRCDFSLGKEGDVRIYKIAFQESSKKPGAPDGGTTQQQELASLFMIRKALSIPSKIYRDIDDLKSDKKGFNELLSVYPELENNTTWLNGLIAQQKTVGQQLKVGRYEEFNRDGGFMDFISKLVGDKFGIRKKDNWNPADVWVIKDERKCIEEIEEATSGSHPTIMELNEVMKRMWADKRLKGISLKAVSGKVARWEEVNVQNLLFTDKNKEPIFELDSSMIKLSLKGKGVFSSQDTIIKVKEGTKYEYKFQIKMNSRGFSNLKFEPTMKGAGAARLGKVPLDMLKTMMQADYRLTFTNNNSDFPKTSEEFVKQQSTFLKMWNNIKNHCETEIRTEEDFINNFMEAFSVESDVANSKLMQLQFLDMLYSKTKAEYNELLTNMVFLAMKKGKYFGPFGKLY
jgi:hypothetical protein